MDLILILAYIVHAATPILLAGLGEMVTEKSGVLNLGVEGMMMIGAFTGFYFAYITSNPLIGILAAALLTGLFSLIHGFITIKLQGNQVVSGLALTFLGTGLATFLGRSFINIKAVSLTTIEIPLLHSIPVIGPIFFNQTFLTYFAYLMTALLLIFIYKTKYGLKLQFCGDSPATADTAGVSVDFYRYSSVFFGGVMAGLGGAFLTLADKSPWALLITGGRGWIAVALVIFGRWNPIGVLLGSYLFGALNSLQFRFQARNIHVSPYLLSMLPYLFTIVILTITSFKFISRKFGSPEALGLPYVREDRE